VKVVVQIPCLNEASTLPAFFLRNKVCPCWFEYLYLSCLLLCR